MVDIYKAQRGEIRNESHFTLPGDIEFVLASDYAALEAELKDVRLAVVRLKMGFDHIQAERDELKRRIDAVVDLIKPAQIKWSKLGMDSPEYHAWCLVAPLYGQAVAIAEGRDNG